MEIADGLAMINYGRLEQVGAPADLYDHPTNDFVLSFLGPVTEFDGTLVRPHDLVVHAGDDRVWVARAVDRELAVPPPRRG